LGSSQLAYQDSNLDKHYGGWGDLLSSNYIQQGYTRSNIIDNYSLAVFYAANPGQRNGRYDYPTFTVVAMPMIGPRGNPGLRTFAICDDQVARVATNFHLNIVSNPANTVPTGDSPCEWDPLR
ncbi:MAG: hypothetical protein ABI743_06255, partial [bacterium]